MIAFALLSMSSGTRITYKWDVAFRTVNDLSRCVELYTLDVRQPPTTEQGLRALIALPPDLPNPNTWGGPYIPLETSLLLDPWKNEYRYASPGGNGRPFDIWSVGTDGIDGTDDDIGHWMDRSTISKYYRHHR